MYVWEELNKAELEVSARCVLDPAWSDVVDIIQSHKEVIELLHDRDMLIDRIFRLVKELARI